MPLRNLLVAYGVSDTAETMPMESVETKPLRPAWSLSYRHGLICNRHNHKSYMKHIFAQIRTAIWLAFAMHFSPRVTSHAAPPSITTQMYDNQHTGWNNQETLTIANVKTNFKLLFKDTTDGQTYSQPLYVPTLNMGRLGTHNVIFVATENNTGYAFDADRARRPLVG